MKLYFLIIAVILLTQGQEGRARRRKHRTNQKEAEQAKLVEENNQQEIENELSVSVKRFQSDFEELQGEKYFEFLEDFQSDDQLYFDIEAQGEDTYYINCE